MSNVSLAKNAFTLFNLEPSFAIDLQALEHSYIQESTKWHPDQNPNASSREKLDRTLKTAEINEAYELLRDPLRRGYHLLNMVAPNLDADSEKTIKDPALLMEAMEDQETLDSISNETDLEVFLTSATSKSETTLSAIHDAFQNTDYTEALKVLYRYRYYNKVRQDAVKKQTQLSG